jgi:hypothetical protein
MLVFQGVIKVMAAAQAPAMLGADLAYLQATNGQGLTRYFWALPDARVASIRQLVEMVFLAQRIAAFRWPARAHDGNEVFYPAVPAATDRS